MKRRGFLASTAAAALSPATLRAQQKTIPVIGYLGSGSPGTSAPFVAAFRQGLRDRLRSSPAIARRIVFELSGYAVVHNLKLAAAFADELRKAGARFAIDGFELSGASLRAAHRLLPEYVKLAEGYSRGIASQADLRYLVESLIRIVHPLEIKLIASNVEDPAILDQLRTLGFDGFQGYAGDRPSPL